MSELSKKIMEKKLGRAMPVKPEPAPVAKPKKAWTPKLKETAADRDKRLGLRPRLPDGSTYLKTYNAEKQEWNGTLSIPGIDSFHATAKASFRVEEDLDNLYREYLRCAEVQANLFQ